MSNAAFVAPGPLQTAVLFLVFNRPDTTQQVFEAIRQAKPPRLYVSADGPRANSKSETQQVERVRQIATAVDWECEVKTLFREENLGCKLAVSSGIDWFFQHEEQGIILEDDCLPSRAFFEFCATMLNFYKYNNQIYSVSGTNFSKTEREFGHVFSKYALMWGWATWADRWQKYSLNPKDHPLVIFKNWWSKPIALFYWLLIYKDVASGSIDTWDYQWILTHWRMNALSCRPSHNLVGNIGFGVDATHSVNLNSPMANLCVYQGNEKFIRALSPIEPDRMMGLEDDRIWAQLNIRSVLLMAFPWLKWIRKLVRSFFK